MLLDAILAFSASHLSRIDSNLTSEQAIEYHDACVRHLIPALQDHELARDEALPVSTVILRMLEMLSYEAGDSQNHLRGTSSLFVYNRNSFGSQSIKHTAFWTYVRQEIMTALQTNLVTNIDTSDKTYYVIWTRNTDDEWTNQITWLTVKVVNHCHNRDQRAKFQPWDDLHKAVDLWKQNVPDRFNPLFVLNDIEGFPVISYLYKWHGK